MSGPPEIVVADALLRDAERDDFGMRTRAAPCRDAVHAGRQQAMRAEIKHGRGERPPRAFVNIPASQSDHKGHACFYGGQ